MRIFFTIVIVLWAVLGLTHPAAAASNQAEIDATQVWIVSTVTVAPFEPFGTSITHINESFNGSMGTHFYYQIGSMFAPYLQNLVYLGSPGTNCTWDVSILRLDCSCSTGITWLAIDFDLFIPMSDYVGSTIWLGWAGTYGGYPIDYTIVLNYPAPLVYLDYYADAPTSDTPTQITWHKVSPTNDIQLIGYASFSDPRVFSLFLPIALR